MIIKVGTRGSRLALTQTNMVIQALTKINTTIEYEVVIIKTKGDLVADISLDKIGDKGLFVTEIENQLISGHIDIAIHSMKDMPSSLPKELMLVSVLEREDPRDVFITPHLISNLNELPNNPKIATGSKRRKSQFLKLRPDAEIVPIRGNVDTRIQKMLDQKLDGLILASAGLKRLNIKSCDEFKVIPLSCEDMIPAPAQGILALELRHDNNEVLKLISNIMDSKTELQANAERLFLKEVNGGCHKPIGAFLKINEDQVTMYGLYGDEDNRIVKQLQLEGSKDEALYLAREIANRLVSEVEDHG